MSVKTLIAMFYNCRRQLCARLSYNHPGEADYAKTTTPKPTQEPVIVAVTA